VSVTGKVSLAYLSRIPVGARSEESVGRDRTVSGRVSVVSPRAAAWTRTRGSPRKRLASLWARRGKGSNASTRQPGSAVRKRSVIVPLLAPPSTSTAFGGRSRCVNCVSQLSMSVPCGCGMEQGSLRRPKGGAPWHPRRKMPRRDATIRGAL